MWPFRRGGDVSGGLGRRGERLAAKFLKRKGLKMLARNYRCVAGEIDLIALDPTTRGEYGGDTLVFVEVKTRSSARHTSPESAVNAAKRRHLEKAASHYLTGRNVEDLSVRFDIVSIVVHDGGPPDIRHILNAF